MRTVALGDHVEILSGFAFKSERFNDEGRGLPLVRIRDVKPAVSQTYYEGEFDSRFLLTNGDLLVGMDGEFNCARWAGGNALLNQRVCRVRAISKFLDEQYLFWFLPKALKDIEQKSNFVTVKHLSTKQINEIEIPLPPLEEQKRIAAILDQADELRRKRQHALDRLNQLGQAIFIEMFGDPKEPSSKWEKLPFSASCEDQTSYSEKLQRGDYLASGAFPVVDQGQSRIAGYCNEPSMVCRSRGPVVLFGDHTRAIKYIDFPFVIGADGAKVLVPSGRFEPRFFAELLRLMPIPDLGYSRHMREVKRLQFPCPPIEAQKAFSLRIALITEHVARLEGAGGRIAKLFTSLQHRAFRGEL